MPQLTVLLLLLIVLGCRSNENKIPALDEKEIGSSTADTNIAEDDDEVHPCYWHNLQAYQTPNGVKIDYQLIDSSFYFLSWQIKDKQRTLPDTFYCESNSNLKPRFVEENKDYVLLRFNCGSPCWGGTILPLNMDQEPETFMYYYDVDFANNLIAFLDNDSKTNAAIIKVKNLKSGKIKEVKIKEPCISAVPIYCLDSLSLKNNELYYQWITETAESKEKKVSKSIKIEI